RELVALPWTVSWGAMLVGGALLRRTRVPGLPAVGPIVVLGVSILFVVEAVPQAIVQGGAAILLTLALGLVQQRRVHSVEHDITTGTTRRWPLQRVLVTTALFAVIVALAPLLGPRLPFADSSQRFDLREHLEPPFDPL